MTHLHAELLRMSATRLPLWTLVCAVLCGGGLAMLLSLIGPEHADPPMAGLDTAEGVGTVLGLGGLMLFVPVLLGTIAVTTEYRHRTIGTSFLVEPHRERVLAAKLAAYALLGLGYGLVSSLVSGLAVVLGAALHGQRLGVPTGELVILLLQLALAAAVHMVLGVGIGALTRHQLLAVGIVLGYFHLLEHLLLLIPGVSTVRSFLPGGASAALTRFTYLTDAVSAQTSMASAPLLPPLVGALVLLGYAVLAAGAALLVPLRRDLA